MYEIQIKQIITIYFPNINIIKNGNKDIAKNLYRETVDYETVKEQYNNLIKTIKTLSPITRIHNLVNYISFGNILKCDNIPNIFFIRDSFIVTDKGIWITKMKEETRYLETKYIEKILIKMGLNIYGKTKKGYLEGGDVYIMNNKYCIIGTGPRSNYEGALEFIKENKYLFEKFIIVYPEIEDTDMHRIHLDCIFAMLDRFNCILWKGSITDKSKPYYRYVDEYILDDKDIFVKNKNKISFFDYLIKENINVIPISDESQKNYGCNILNLGNNKILVQDHETYRKIPNSTYVDLSEVHKMYGGIHCITNISI